MNYYSTSDMQNINEQTLQDIFEESSNSELDDVFFGEDETYGDILTTLEMNLNEDENADRSLSTHVSDLSDCDEEFNLDPLPCNDSEQLADDYDLSIEGGGLNIFHQDIHPGAISPESESTGSLVTPNNMMAKLEKCMERSALSRSLVETFYQTSLKVSVSQENIQVSSSMATKKSEECIQESKISIVKASASRTTKKDKIGSFLRNKKNKNKKPSDSFVSIISKKDDNFRASGLKLSTKALIAKLDILKRGNQDNGSHRIASFLRLEKLKSTVLQMGPQAA